MDTSSKYPSSCLIRKAAWPRRPCLDDWRAGQSGATGDYCRDCPQASWSVHGNEGRLGVKRKSMKVAIKPLAASVILLFAAEPMAFGQGPTPIDISGNWRMEQGSCIGNISIGAPPNSGGANWSAHYSAQCGGNSSMNAQYRISANANGEYRFTGNPTSGGSVFSEEFILTWTGDGKALIGTGTESGEGKSLSIDVSMHR